MIYGVTLEFLCPLLAVAMEEFQCLFQSLVSVPLAISGTPLADSGFPLIASFGLSCEESEDAQNKDDTDTFTPAGPSRAAFQGRNSISSVQTVDSGWRVWQLKLR